MKKLISLLMALIMMMSLVACANDTTTDTPADDDAVIENETEDTNEVEGEDETAGDNTEDNAATGTTDETLGQILLKDFQETVAATPDMTAQKIADDLMTNPAILFAPATMPVEEGFLSGFTSDITGFEEAAMFAPMIGSIPFVGYIFTLSEDANVDAFIDTLEANADLRWNICVEAEEMVVDNVDNTVFFVMCPTTLDAE